MLVQRELDFIKEIFEFANSEGQLSKPESMDITYYYYFLQRIGFKKGDQVMKDQGFPGDVAQPEVFIVSRSNVLEPEDFLEACRRR
jgi:hypothetical protein